MGIGVLDEVLEGCETGPTDALLLGSLATKTPDCEGSATALLVGALTEGPLTAKMLPDCEGSAETVAMLEGTGVGVIVKD